jgi:hypothetical protein
MMDRNGCKKGKKPIVKSSTAIVSDDEGDVSRGKQHLQQEVEANSTSSDEAAVH